MSKREVKHRDISARERLRAIARQLNISDQVILTLYCQERLLARLGQSPYRDHFYLKGGLYLFARARQRESAVVRPTRDIDFTGTDVSNGPKNLAKTFAEVCVIALDDGVVFDSADIKTEAITPRKECEGTRIHIPAKLATTRNMAQIDVAFGDVVTPAPRQMRYRPLLPDMTPPDILVYSAESVVAEKLHAMVVIALDNSRMKDFYDVVALARDEPFAGRLLTRAVRNTFEARDTPWQEAPEVFQPAFAQDEELQREWTAYLRRERLDAAQADFRETVALVQNLLAPV